MNDFSELEADLKKLPLAPVSETLPGRIAIGLAQLETPTAGVLPRPRWRDYDWRSLGLGIAGVAALLTLGLAFLDRSTPSSPAPVARQLPAASSGFEPVGLTQVVYSGRDEGLVALPNESGTLRRRMRYETRETMRWHNAQTGASVRVSYPAEQVVLTPVSFQ